MHVGGDGEDADAGLDGELGGDRVGFGVGRDAEIALGDAERIDTFAGGRAEFEVDFGLVGLGGFAGGVVELEDDLGVGGEELGLAGGEAEEALAGEVGAEDLVFDREAAAAEELAAGGADEGDGVVDDTAVAGADFDGLDPAGGLESGGEDEVLVVDGLAGGYGEGGGHAEGEVRAEGGFGGELGGAGEAGEGTGGPLAEEGEVGGGEAAAGGHGVVGDGVADGLGEGAGLGEGGEGHGGGFAGLMAGEAVAFEQGEDVGIERNGQQSNERRHLLIRYAQCFDSVSFSSQQP